MSSGCVPVPVTPVFPSAVSRVSVPPLPMEKPVIDPLPVLVE